MMMLLDQVQNADGEYYRKAESTYVQDVDDNSDTHSSSSEGLSDDGFCRETASSRSSVTSPGSPVCLEASSSSVPQTCSGSLPDWAVGNYEPTSYKPVPLEQRQNPRRTSNASECKQPPPSLVRQSERKECFVACLVSFATQFVEAIWPLAACTPRTDTSFHGRGVLSLQSFITETLRRSRTSYSTLQVALFYLVLIKDFVPRCNFTMEQPKGSDEFKAMQCGRRMFLTALILASKYLQDRNYSTRAWSKISGLRAQEIHSNEMEYCKKISWVLHVPKEKFDRWSYTVLKLSSPLGKSGSETVAKVIGWQKVLAKLNRDLTETFPTREDFLASPPLSMCMPTNFVFGESTPERRNNETSLSSSTSAPSSTSSEKTITPQVPPKTCIMSQPPQPRIDNLPTPQSTPHPNPFNTFTSMAGTPSMCAAMSQIRNQGLVRVTRDQCPPPQGYPTRWGGSRSSSLCRTTSGAPSPPESVISEAPSLVHSRSSRSSSISSSASGFSVASIAPRLGRCAPQRAAALAKERGMPIDSMLCRSGQTNETQLQKMLADLDTCTTSPESWEQQSNGGDSDPVEHVTVWSKVPSKYTMKSIGPQDWEAAQALCKLPSLAAPPSWQTSSPDDQQFSMLSRSVSADDGAQLTPRPVDGRGISSENASPSACHKRTHSKTTDQLQDQVRNQLRRTFWSTEMPDRTVNTTHRNIPCQSPTQTFGEKKLPVPTKASEGHKRHCAYQSTAAVRAAEMLKPKCWRSGACR